ncbi:hypothetical protein WL88_29280 [Burkholderia diffusa]|uniref:Uncharacterized protein n=1 Tax=Burkholderia diffusa TaxID=488732 RepID=A0AAW3P8F4_9BURK|nr:hypothetical protein WL85_00475 [Burkholderia diffusa]KWF44256.1 hypothetical protein WL86_08910 [Burkholderia diffusa]KWF45165.1 hypothetical protein WL88_29280 [Burkholderia diffusa]KWF51149.1 hypothetical protein WL87_14925 [Burkholderia diffusa]
MRVHGRAPRPSSVALRALARGRPASATRRVAAHDAVRAAMSWASRGSVCASVKQACGADIADREDHGPVWIVRTELS